MLSARGKGKSFFISKRGTSTAEMKKAFRTFRMSKFLVVLESSPQKVELLGVREYLPAKVDFFFGERISGDVF